MGAQDLKLSPMFAGVCSDSELVRYFMRTCNERVLERVRNSGPEFHILPVADKTKLAVRWRLEMLEPYISVFLTPPPCYTDNAKIDLPSCISIEALQRSPWLAVGLMVVLC